MHYEVHHYQRWREDEPAPNSKYSFVFDNSNPLLLNRMRALKNICQWPWPPSQIYSDRFTPTETLHPDLHLSDNEQAILADSVAIPHEHISHTNYYQTIFKLVDEDQEIVIWRNNRPLDEQALLEEFDLYQRHGIPDLGYFTDTDFGRILDPSLIGRTLYGSDFHSSSNLPPAAQIKCRNYIFGRLIAPDPF